VQDVGGGPCRRRILSRLPPHRDRRTDPRAHVGMVRASESGDLGSYQPRHSGRQEGGARHDHDPLPA